MQEYHRFELILCDFFFVNRIIFVLICIYLAAVFIVAQISQYKITSIVFQTNKSDTNRHMYTHLQLVSNL